jgi:hypothetical protein
MARLQYLSEEEIWKYYSRLDLNRTAAELTGYVHIGSKGKVMRMAFDTGRRQKTDSAGGFYSMRKLITRQFFPEHRLSSW